MIFFYCSFILSLLVSVIIIFIVIWFTHYSWNINLTAITLFKSHISIQSKASFRHVKIKTASVNRILAFIIPRWPDDSAILCHNIVRGEWWSDGVPLFHVRPISPPVNSFYCQRLMVLLLPPLYVDGMRDVFFWYCVFYYIYLIT